MYEKMTELNMIFARKIFFRNLGANAQLPLYPKPMDLGVRPPYPEIEIHQI